MQESVQEPTRDSNIMIAKRCALKLKLFLWDKLPFYSYRLNFRV